MPSIWAYADERFVRLAAGFDGSRARESWGSARRILIAALLLLFSVPVTTILGASIIAHFNDRASDDLEVALAPKLELERRARDAEALRRARWLHLRQFQPATATLVDLANKLPQNAWVRTVGRRADGALALTVDATDPDQVREARSRTRQCPAGSAR